MCRMNSNVRKAYSKASKRKAKREEFEAHRDDERDLPEAQG